MMDSKNKIHINLPLLPLSYFFLGFFSLISQAVIIREFLVVIFGNEIIMGILFFNWLIGIFAGAFSGAYVVDHIKKPAFFFVTALLFMCLLLPAAITCIRFLYAVSGTAAGTYIGFFKVFLFSGIFILPLVFFIGFSFPLAAGIQFKTGAARDEHVEKIINIYIVEAAGFLSGGIIYTFVLAGRCNPYSSAGLVLLPLLLSAAAISRRFKYYKILFPTLILLVLNIALLFFSFNGKIEQLTAEKRWKSVSSTPLIYSVNSKYQNIAISGLYDQYYLYLNSMYTAVFPGDQENTILAAHLVCQHPAPKRVLIIGNALTGPAKCLLAYNLEKIVSVEIDPILVKTILKFLPAEEKKILADRRFKTVIKDGRRYVKELAGRQAAFDIVYLDVPEPATLMLNRFYTKDFFSDLAKIMSQDGIVAFSITSSENYGQGLVSDYTASLYHTVASVFPETVVAPGARNFIFASRSKQILSDNPEILALRYAMRGIKPEKLGKIFHSLYPKQKTGFIKKTLQNSRTYRINRDVQPQANFYFSKILGWYAGSSLAGILDVLEKIKFQNYLLLLLVLFLLRFGYVFHKRKNSPKIDYRQQFLISHTLLSVFCCGSAGLALELVILYIFQNVFGYVYHIIGFIIALFMSGLPAGACLSSAVIKRKSGEKTAIIKLLILLQLSLSLFSLFVSRLGRLFITNPLPNQILIYFVTILIGFTVGMVFPAALHIYLSHAKISAAKTAGIVNAYDHSGAAVGALFMGTLLLPLTGVFNMCLLVSALLTGSSLLLGCDMFALRSPSSKS